jgi:hypothetical protein
MNNDALSPQEYLDACDLGIQNKPKAYIRARLDTEDALRQDFRSSGGQSQNNGSTARRVATGAAIAGGVAALAYGGHRSGAFRRAGSALRKAAPRLRTAGSTGMRKARTGMGMARRTASSGLGRARSGFATGARKARVGLEVGKNKLYKERMVNRRINKPMPKPKLGPGGSIKSPWADSMYADGFTLDAAVFDGLIREDIKCGAGAISKGEKCHKGAGGGPTQNRWTGGGALGGLTNTVHPYYVKRGVDPSSVKQMAKLGVKQGAIGGSIGGALGGAAIGALTGGGRGAVKGALLGAAGGTAYGAGVGALGGASEALGYKTGKAIRGQYQAGRANNAKIQSAMSKLGPRQEAELKRARTKGASRSEMQALRHKHAREVTQSLQRIGA